MKFQLLAGYLENIEKTASRLEMTRVLSDLFTACSAEDIVPTTYLIQGRIAPIYDPIDFGMAEKMVTKSILDACKIDQQSFTKEFRKHGDLGTAVTAIKLLHPSLHQRDLLVQEVYDRLLQTAQAGGEGSQQTKISNLAALIQDLDPLSAGYVVRIPLGVMRLGFSDMTILDAYSWMLTGDKSYRKPIERAYQVRPDLGYIGKLLKEKGIESLDEVTPQVFTPILMMRAERLSSSAEILDKIGNCLIEAKYDGFRLQAHLKNGVVRLYSRGLEEVSFMYPDIVAGIEAEVHAADAIIEGEAIGFDEQTGSFLPFQQTVQRKRKYNIDEKAKEIPLKMFAFELLYADGVSYVQEPFAKRRAMLEQLVQPTGDIYKDVILLAPKQEITQAREIELIFDDAISRGLEGIIAKKKDGMYEPGARGWNWIKFKRSYSAKIDDTLDCLVMGYDFGKGKRSNFGIGAFLVGVYDHQADMYFTVAKIGTGLTDDEWKLMKDACERIRVHKKPAFYDIDQMMACDVWVDPQVVVEIKADEITRSPVHTAGRVLTASKSGSAQIVETPGYALRFPRLVRVRSDKLPTDATSVSEIAAMFEAQRS